MKGIRFPVNLTRDKTWIASACR